MTHPLQLSSDAQVAQGVQRSVYLHPTDDAKLIKVLRPDADRPQRRTFNGVMDRLMPSTRIRQIRKEYSEYLRVMLQNPQPDFHLPIAHMFGFVATSEGLGCLTERVGDAGGGLGTTLSEMMTANTLTQDDLALLNATIAAIFAASIRASDMNAKNFVFGHRKIAGTLGPRECVLVDGFGDTHAIPVRSMARWANQIALNNSCQRLALKTGLQWDAQQRQFRTA